LNDGAGVQVVLLRLFWTKAINEVSNRHLLLGFDLSEDFWLVVRIDEGQEFIEDLRNRFLVDVSQEIFDDSRILSKDEWEELLLLSANQERNKLAEIARKDWVELFITLSFDEFEESFE
jgi:hypothetical protein